MMSTAAVAELYEAIERFLRQTWFRRWLRLPEHSGIDPLHPPLPRASSERMPEAARYGCLSGPFFGPVHAPC